MLSDFKQRKFQARNPLSGEMLDPALIEVEQALLKYVDSRAGSVADFSFRYPASVKPY